MENLTTGELGFDEIEMILMPKQPRDCDRYNTIAINKPEEVIIKFLINKVSTYYLQNRKPNTSYCGIAYMCDGRIVMVSTDKFGSSRVYAMTLEKDVGKKKGFKDNIEYVTHVVKSNKPAALLLIQQVEADHRDFYEFRIIHDRKEDWELRNVIQFPRD